MSSKVETLKVAAGTSPANLAATMRKAHDQVHMELIEFYNGPTCFIFILIMLII